MWAVLWPRFSLGPELGVRMGGRKTGCEPPLPQEIALQLLALLGCEHAVVVDDLSKKRITILPNIGATDSNELESRRNR